MATKAPSKRKAPAKSPAPAQDSTAFGPIAERFRRAGDHDRAISLCREGLSKFPNHVSARVTLGWALLETGKYDEARVELEAVLRRAPDNLAAIRGLAELHDRSEHTLNLPMDGPGQWPPDAATFDEQNQEASKPAPASKSSGAKAVAAVEPSAAVIAPAELGLAMWSPVQAAEEAAAEAPVQVPVEVPPTSAVEQTPAPPAAAAVYVQVAQPAQSGMSSMRELDPNAVVVQVQPEAEAAAPAPEESAAVVEAAADTVDLAALIAEADKLDAVAEVDDNIPTTIDLDAQIDLTEFGDASLAAEPFEVGGTEVTEVAKVTVDGGLKPADYVLAAEPEVVEEPIVVAEPAAVYVATPLAEAEPVAIEPEPEPVAAVAAYEAIAEPDPPPIAAAPIVRNTSKPQILALERLLKQVQTRRLVLVAESVA